MKFEKIVCSIFYADLQESHKLFIDCLGFMIVHQELTISYPYYVIEKDGLSLMLFQDKQEAEKHYPEIRLVTNDIEEVYAKVAATHPELLHPNLNKVTLRPLGANEFAIKDEQVGVRLQEG